MNIYKVTFENDLWLLKVAGTQVVMLSNINRNMLLKDLEEFFRSRNEEARVKVFNTRGGLVEEGVYGVKNC